MRKDHADEVKPYTLPVESDILVVHSSYYGKYSLRYNHNYTVSLLYYYCFLVILTFSENGKFTW